MTLEDWKKESSLVKWCSSVFNSPEGQKFIAMLNESHVKNNVRLDGGNPCQNSLDLGEIRGYDKCINNIESSCQIKKPQKIVEETWGVVDEPKQKK